MASNLSTIGFTFADEESFRSAMMTCASEASVRLDCCVGHYGLWRSRTGAEVWFHLGQSDDGNTEIFGLTPFFEGQSDVALKITGPIAREGDNPFEGALTGWVSPDAANEGSYPIVFDAVDFAALNDAVWPDVRHVRLTGFAREVQAFSSDEAYYAARGAADAEHPKLASHAFIPVGLFAAAQAGEGANDNEPGDASSNADAPNGPTSSALLTGKILDHRTLTNEASGNAFVWMLVESLEATFDIIADPAVITGELTDGGTIEAAVWMFGRMLD
ncbi:MAG: hypothetical protein ABL893_03040 [Hyphomicrobium sp.]